MSWPRVVMLFKEELIKDRPVKHPVVGRPGVVMLFKEELKIDQ